MEAWFLHLDIRMGCELGRACTLIYMVTLADALRWILETFV